MKRKRKTYNYDKGLIMPRITLGKPGELIDLGKLTFSTSLACRYVPHSLKGYLLSKEGWLVGKIKLKVFGGHYVRIPKKCRYKVMLKYQRWYDEQFYVH